MLLCFPVLGLGVFSAAAVSRKSTNFLQLAAKGVKAEGMETADGFIVRSGSEAVQSDRASYPKIQQLRAALIGNGVLKLVGDRYAFTQDYTFSSPSMAAGVVQGGAINGRVAWKTKDGKTLKEMQEALAKA